MSAPLPKNKTEDIGTTEKVKDVFGKIFSFQSFAIALIISGIVLAVWYLFFGNFLTGTFLHPDTTKPVGIQPFIAGIVMPLLTLGSTLLVIENLRTTRIQNFSSNFFKLIDQHHKLVDCISEEVSGTSLKDEPSKGRDFFDDLAYRIAKDYEAIMTGKHDMIDVNCKDLIKSAAGKVGVDLLKIIYDYYYHLHHSSLSHYFRNLYHIIRFTERSSLRKHEKTEFIKMLRAQLSNYEILIIAYNGIHIYGDKLKPKLEKYMMLKNLNDERSLSDNWEKRIIDPNVLGMEYKHLNHWIAK